MIKLSNACHKTSSSIASDNCDNNRTRMGLLSDIEKPGFGKLLTPRQLISLLNYNALSVYREREDFVSMFMTV